MRSESRCEEKGGAEAKKKRRRKEGREEQSRAEQSKSDGRAEHRFEEENRRGMKIEEERLTLRFGCVSLGSGTLLLQERTKHLKPSNVYMFGSEIGSSVFKNIKPRTKQIKARVQLVWFD